MRTFSLREPLGTRPLDAADFPLSIGGPGAAVVVPGLAAGVVAAVVGLGEEGPFLQGVGEASAVRLGGGALEGSAWLTDGVRFEIGTARGRIEALGEDWSLVLEHDGGSNATEPPLFEESGAVVEAAELPARHALEAIAFAAPAGAPGAPRAADAVRRICVARLGLIAAGGAAVAALAFLMAASAVSIRVKPDLDPDVAHFEGAFPDVGSASHRLLLPGAYRLRVAKAGFVPAVVPVTVTSAAGQRFEVALERLPGRLRLDTSGIAASVTVDGRPAGRAPGELTLPAGTRVLTLAAPRYAPVTTRVEIEGLGHAQDLKVALEPLFARVRFESVPAGATVLVDGVALGAAPLSAEVDSGRRAVTFTHPEFRAWESLITVKAGEAQTVGPVQLGLPDGTLIVRTEPAGADVSVAGAYRGRTPLTLALAPGAAHEVVVTRPGYAAATRSVRLAPRATETLTVALLAQLGEVLVEGDPADAELVVDGHPQGAANQRLRLPAVPHTLEVRKAGVEPFRTSVTPQPGLLQAVRYSLKTAAELKAARFRPTLRTGSGQILKLLPAGSFAMGSARREPGRRSNEPQRKVELRRPVYLALRAVTNLEFREFKPDHLTGAFRQETLDLDALPVANVSWQEAAEYCNWLSAKDGLPPAYARTSGKFALTSPATTGYRLPTEAEWEYAARWNGAGNDRKYPWGSQLPIPPKAGNFADERAVYLQGQILSGYDDGFRVAAPVGSFPPNPLGFFDLGGNVLEWTSDFYTVYPDGGPPVVDPAGPADGETHAIRGSSWLTASVAELRLAWRDYGSSGRQNLGFRIARYAE
jgi:formylglycine-generating enzyme required for sulfatase activity